MVGRIMPNFIEVRQGDSFTIQLQFKDENGFIDISGACLKMQIKTGKGCLSIPPPKVYH